MSKFILFSTTEEFNHDCDSLLLLTERIVGRGTAYVNQCTFCGRQIGQSFSKKNITEILPPFDTDLHSDYEYHHARVMNIAKSRLQSVPDTREIVSVYDRFEKELDAFIDAFVEKNNSGSSKAKNSLINSYLTKKSNRYYESLTSKWCDEPQLKQWFLDVFSKWFHIYPEVRGVGYINGVQKNIILDFVIMAKQELLAEGFTAEPVGVEVKYIKTNTGDGFTKSASQGVFQALSYAYSNSTWDIPNNPKSRLCCVMMVSNLSHRHERDFLDEAPGRFKARQWGGFLNLARHANVGEIHYYDRNRSRDEMWSFKFSGGTYFTFHGNGKYQLRNTNLINKERIGNIQ